MQLMFNLLKDLRYDWFLHKNLILVVNNPKIICLTMLSSHHLVRQFAIKGILTGVTPVENENQRSRLLLTISSA